jgi:hypothetical protein
MLELSSAIYKYYEFPVKWVTVIIAAVVGLLTIIVGER